MRKRVGSRQHERFNGFLWSYKACSYRECRCCNRRSDLIQSITHTSKWRCKSHAGICTTQLSCFVLFFLILPRNPATLTVWHGYTKVSVSPLQQYMASQHYSSSLTPVDRPLWGRTAAKVLHKSGWVGAPGRVPTFFFDPFCIITANQRAGIQLGDFIFLISVMV